MNVTDNFHFFREKSRTVRAWFYLVTPDETTPGKTRLVTDSGDECVGDMIGMLVTS